MTCHQNIMKLAARRVSVHDNLCHDPQNHAIFPRLVAQLQPDLVPGEEPRAERIYLENKSPAVMRTTFQGSRFCPACARTALRLPRNAGRMLIWIYRHTLSPLVGFNCRHLPTCSAYGDEAIARFGLWGGGWMTLARILRCHPWGTSGIDNVPVAKPSSATWYRPWRYGRWRSVNAK